LQKNAKILPNFSPLNEALSNIMNKELIAYLDGYLHSLRRLSGNLCDFWVETFEFKNDIETGFRDHLADTEISIVKKSQIGYKEIDQILEENILSKLLVKDTSLLGIFSWDIVEYLQMTYQLIEPEINPMYKKEALLFTAKSEFHGEFVYIVVPVLNQAVVVGLATRA
tara:strand:+ start:2793 stop:3296 length:504 start_codon:yes stop_codon:yes gene_type:complete